MSLELLHWKKKKRQTCNRP